MDPVKKFIRPVTGIVALTAVLIEMYVKVSTGMTVVQLLSFFTIQSNIIVAVYCFASMRKQKFILNSSGFFGLALLNITITGVIFFLLLRNIYQPEGISYLTNIMLHYITPILMLLVFVVIRDRRPFEYKYVVYWMLYAAAYLGYSMARGAVIGTYPYPFIDLTKLSFGQVAVNSVSIAAAFGVIALLFVVIDRRVSGSR